VKITGCSSLLRRSLYKDSRNKFSLHFFEVSINFGSLNGFMEYLNELMIRKRKMDKQ
jgi:hypothetical protein